MTRKVSTKRALLMSALSLLLCVSMLIGSTYAWFTDSVTSGSNVITSGNLDIEVQYTLGEKDAAGELIWANLAGATDLFKKGLWEPGHTEVVALRIENKGSLALKYVANMNIFNEIVGENKDGGEIVLSDILTVSTLPMDGGPIGGALASTIFTSDDAAIWQSSEVKTSSFKAGNVLANDNIVLAGEDAYVLIKVDMAETVGNEANHNGVDVPSIEFGLNVLATQYTYEEDSFGSQYDKDAAEDGIRVEENGLVLVYTDDNTFLEKVTADYVGDTLVIPAGVTSVGYGTLATGGTQVFAANPGIKNVVFPASVRNIGYQAFKDSAVESVVLNEGLTVIGEYAFNGAKKLASFNIPSTVTEIGSRAFRSTAATEVVIPASVVKISDAFRDMANLTTVTIEGNAEIGDYAFRQCANLRTVNLLGDDVIIGKNMAFANASSGNPGTNNITFNVANDVVASRVKTAMGVGTDYFIFVNGKEVTIKSVATVAQLQSALDSAADGTIISLTADIAGNISFSQNVNIDVVINGNGHKFDGSINIKAQSDTTSHGSITIKNIAFKTDAAEKTFIASSETNHYPLNVTISGCSFEGTGAGSNVVGISVKGAMNMVIEDCTANNVHSILQNTAGWNLTVRDVTVTNSGRGFALGTVQGVSLTNVKVEAAKYGVRMDTGYNNNAVITNCDITAFIPVVVRKVNVDSNVTFNGTNTMTQTNTDGIWCAIGTSEYEANGALPTNAAKVVTVTVNDAGLNTAGICNNSGK